MGFDLYMLLHYVALFQIKAQCWYHHPTTLYSISPSVTIDKHLVVLVHTKSTFELITAG